jgi:hypothetical protein
VLDYFPAALAQVAILSRRGNEKHNPGEEMHHARGKSSDHADCILRHLAERGTVDPEDGLLHDVKVAWRALAMLQERLEERGAPLARGARLPAEEVPDESVEFPGYQGCPGLIVDEDLARIEALDPTGLKARGYTDEDIAEIEAEDPIISDEGWDAWAERTGGEQLCPNYAGDRIAGDDAGTLSRTLKNKYYHGEDRPEEKAQEARAAAYAAAGVVIPEPGSSSHEIAGYCAWCDLELPLDHAYIRSPRHEGLLFCSSACVCSLVDWQAGRGFGP